MWYTGVYGYYVLHCHTHTFMSYMNWYYMTCVHTHTHIHYMTYIHTLRCVVKWHLLYFKTMNKFFKFFSYAFKHKTQDRKPGAERKKKASQSSIKKDIMCVRHRFAFYD